jgi:hypothetical protein
MVGAQKHQKFIFLNRPPECRCHGVDLQYLGFFKILNNIVFRYHCRRHRIRYQIIVM